MSIYLPIAEMSVNGLLIILISGAIGFFSGMVGVGGGFIMTPALIFMGVPPPVAVATQASQITASSLSGVIAHARRRAVDLRMGLLITIGGVAGSTFGVWVFAWMKALGQLDLLISLFYVLFLGVIGALMLWESVAALRRRASGAAATRRRRKRGWAHRLPMRLRFPQSGLYMSALPPIGIGVVTGVLAAIMGVGGGFIAVPAMIYILRMPTNVVIGTSLFSIIIIAALVTVLQAAQTRTVDLVLAALLIVGGVIGAQLGARVGARLKAEELRVILAGVVLATALRLLWDLVARPTEIFVLAS
ncbi:MAG: sulfite exporter TauE/SafE family protein [Hyphomonadaceae bacterium]|nr:sulfite exporter TauE/SafE family protein [Hyphomonadaceae bacterium]